MITESITSLDGFKFEGPFLIKPQIYKDSRGFFLESWNQKEFDKSNSESIIFLQDNHSFSHKGVIRGLHYQEFPSEQGKLVRCIRGKIFDVLVDIRPDSKTFSKWSGVILSAENFYQLWIPEGFAHGFLVVSEEAEILYKTTNYWDASNEKTIIWNDPYLNIKWPLEINNIFNPIVSAKDREGKNFINLFGI